MNIQTQSAAIAAIITIAITIGILLRNHKNRLYILFAIFNFNLFVWHVSTFLSNVSESKLWYQVTIAAAVFIPFFTYKFFKVFLLETEIKKIRDKYFLISSLILAILVFIPPVSDFQPYYFLVFIYIFALLFFSIYLTYQKYKRSSSSLEKTRLKYLIVFGIITIGINLIDSMHIFNVLPAVGNIITMVYIYLIAQILIKYRLLDFIELVSKGAVLALLTIILTIIFTALVRWVDRGDDGQLLFNTMVASLVILIVFEPMKNLVEDKINKFLFGERFQLGGEIHKIAADIKNIIHIDPLIQMLLDRFKDSRRVTDASIYLLDTEYRFSLFGHVGLSPVLTIEYVKHRSFFDRLQDEKFLLIENIEGEIADLKAEDPIKLHDKIKVKEEIIQLMVAMNSGVCVSLTSNENIIGLINLRDERFKEAYSGEEIRDLLSLAAQLSISIENSKRFEKIKERDQMALIGEMSAGLAHEIRNPLSAIKGAAQLIEAGETAPGNSEIFKVIIEETNRLNSIVTAFLDFARPYKATLVDTNINQVIEKTVTLARREMGEASPIRIIEDLAPTIPLIKGDEDQLKQVFINIIKNSLQVLPNGGEILIRTSIQRDIKNAFPLILSIEIKDSGPGIEEEALKNIFIPFFTTKKDGTGLGLPICQKIIKNHGGRIEVKSKVAQGTTFRITLPISDQPPTP